MSGDVLQNYDLASAALLSRADVQVLSADQERALVLEFDECKTRLLEVRQLLGGELSGTSPDDEEIQAIVRQLLNRSTVKTEVVRQLAAERYNEIRTKLAMANLRLVAYVARKFRNRGITSSDLLLEPSQRLANGIRSFRSFTSQVAHVRFATSLSLDRADDPRARHPLEDRSHCTTWPSQRLASIGPESGQGPAQARRRDRRGIRPIVTLLEERFLLSTLNLTVTTLADPSGPTGTVSLRQAINTANADTIDSQENINNFLRCNHLRLLLAIVSAVP